MSASDQPPTEPPTGGRSVHRDGEPPEEGWIVRGLIPVDACAGGTPLEQPPPTVAELEAGGLIAPDEDPYRYFSEKERTIVDWLVSHGMTRIRSVKARGRPGKPTPDAVFDHIDGRATLELKTLDSDSPGATYAGIRTGRKQSSVVVIDGRRKAITREAAEVGLRRGIRVHGVDVDQAIVVLADGTAIGWRP